MIDIFSRLPVKTILCCKSFCKPWLNLLTSPEFVKCHLSNSKPSVVFSLNECNDRSNPLLCRETEFERYSTIAVFGFMEFSDCPKGSCMVTEGSVNGLMLCRMENYRDCKYYICNPITREYIKLPPPQWTDLGVGECRGFGFSKMTGEYKMIRLSYEYRNSHLLMCEVYTLGTGSWRSIPIAPGGSRLKYFCHTKGAFLNGNLHWLAIDFEARCLNISCFDLETELFSTFSTPVRSTGSHPGDSLHLIDYEWDGINCGLKAIVWSMKEYGVDRSWTKECVISTKYSRSQPYKIERVINIFSNGDVLIELNKQSLLYYSSKSRTGKVMCMPALSGLKYVGMLYSPSFLSLKNFAMEDVRLF